MKVAQEVPDINDINHEHDRKMRRMEPTSRDICDFRSKQSMCFKNAHLKNEDHYMFDELILWAPTYK